MLKERDTTSLVSSAAFEDDSHLINAMLTDNFENSSRWYDSAQSITNIKFLIKAGFVGNTLFNNNYPQQDIKCKPFRHIKVF
jgi:hypothetical protein